jgi:Peptidase family S64
MGIHDPIPVDVQKVGKGRAEALVSATRPAQPGFSVGNRVGGSGTIGCVVQDRATSNQFGLTCAHVLAPVPTASMGDRVLVPSLDEARASHVLGRAPMGSLEQFLPPVFSDSAVAANVDVATFSPTNPATLDPTIAIVGKRPSGIASTVTVGTPVRKVGASSELTTGEVKFIHMIFWLAYPTPTGEEVTAGFEDLIGISHFSNFGDSGSLVITEDGKAVGIVLGSSPEFTACLPIERALDALNCDLVTG